MIPSARDVSRPVIPLGAFSNGLAFSSSLCGAWSVTIISIVPSLIPSIILILSSSVLNGGFILALVPYLSTASSVRVKWCGVASACTSAPSFLAVLTISTEFPELICCIHTDAPVCNARIQSLATITSSAVADAPPYSSCSATFPWLTPGLIINSGSSSWRLIGKSNSAAFFMASTRTCSFIIGIPSSVNPTAPALASASISTSSTPFNSLVTDAVCKTWIPVVSPFFWIYSRVSILSTAGLVLAMQTTLVKPPFAAAAAPVIISSL